MHTLLLLIATASNASEPFSFTVVGDTQTDGSHTSINWDVVPPMIEGMNALEPDLSIFVGDLVGGSGSLSTTVSQWQDFDSVTSALTSTRYLVPGNHDMYGGQGTFNAWATMWPELPRDNSPEGEEGMTYYFDYEGVRFISVLTDDPVRGYVSVTQPDWLDAVLAESGDFEHIFVYTHHPVSFSTESPTGGSEGRFWQSLIAADVTGFFSGHWHRYQPSQLGGGGETWETIIGTGGGAFFPPWREYQQRFGFLLVEVDGARVDATFYTDSDGDGDYDDAIDHYVMSWDGEPETGLVAHYDFQDGLEDLGALSISKDVDGELFGDANWLESGGVVGGGVRLGGDGYVEAGSIGDYVLAFKFGMTISAFAKVDSVPSGSWGGAIMSYGTSDYYSEDEETNYSYWLSILDDGRLLSFWEFVDGSNISYYSTESAPLDGEWHQYSLSRDMGSSELIFYVDGQPLGEPVAFDQLPSGGGRGMLYLGADVAGSTGYEMTGAIDEVCLFNRTLTPDEVAEIYSSKSCILEVPEPEDTGGTGESTDTGPDTDTDTDTDTDLGGGVEDVVGSGGCGCATTLTPRTWWWSLFFTVVIIGSRRSNVTTLKRVRMTAF